MNFGQAIEALKRNQAVRRAGWNGKNMYVYLEERAGFEPSLSMFTAHGKHQPGWLANQADILAEDWEIVGAVAGS